MGEMGQKQNEHVGKDDDPKDKADLFEGVHGGTSGRKTP
jgi:hypothetical protein